LALLNGRYTGCRISGKRKFNLLVGREITSTLGQLMNLQLRRVNSKPEYLPLKSVP